MNKLIIHYSTGVIVIGLITNPFYYKILRRLSTFFEKEFGRKQLVLQEEKNVHGSFPNIITRSRIFG